MNNQQMSQITEETIKAQVAAAIQAGQADGSIRKAIDTTTGLVGYVLEAPARQLVPLMTPFHQMIPRSVRGADSVHWKVITQLGSPDIFTTERASGNRFSTTVVPKVAAYKIVALRGEVTREAIAISAGFDPAMAKESTNCLLNAMKLEWLAMLGANTGDALGAPANIAVTDRTGKGSINAGAGTTYYVNVLAMTLPAAQRVLIDQPSDYDGTDAFIVGRKVTAVNPLRDDNDSAITTGCGLSNLGTEANSGSLTSTGHGLKVTWDPVPGAVAYAVAVGTTSGAANLKFQAVVTQTSITLKSLDTTGLAANAAEVPSTDQTTSTKAYDGIIPQILAADSGAYVKNVNAALSGTASTAEVTDIQDMFANIYMRAKIGKFRLLVGGTESRALTKLGVITNAMQIFTQPSAAGRQSFTIGAHAGEILNHTTGDVVPIDVDPWLPGGLILCLPTEIPYNDANISTPIDWVGAHDWERWDYASTTATGPIYPFDVRAFGVPRLLFGAGCGLLYNVFKA